MNQQIKRCGWVGDDPLMILYHDREWGVSTHDDNKLFEFLILDCFQAGLSWSTILKKRINFRRAFSGFNPAIIAKYKEVEIKKITDLPAHCEESDKMSLDLQKRGFKFAGSTICYAFMQAAGLVNDHLIDCFRYKEIS